MNKRMALGFHKVKPSYDKLLDLLMVLNVFFALAFYVSAFYPGYLTSDSKYMLTQGLAGQTLTNWHSPFLVLVWGGLFSFFKSSGGLWLLQIVGYTTAVFLLTRSLSSKHLALVVQFTLLYFTPLFANMAALWKDDWAVFLTLALVSWYSLWTKTHRNLLLWLGLAAALGVCLIRIDYLAIVLPFAAILGQEALRRYRFLNLWKRSLVASAAFVLCVFLSSAAFDPFVSRKLAPWEPIAVWDIAGTEEFSRDAPGTVPGYTPKTSDPVVFGPFRVLAISLPEETSKGQLADETSGTLKKWVSTVLAHPMAYLQHRLAVAGVFLGFGDSVHYPYPRAEYFESPLTQKADRSPLNLDLYWYIDKNAASWLFRYWVYLVGALVVLGLSLTFRISRWVILPLVGSVMLAAARVAILPAADFRYGLWIVVGSIVCLAILLDSSWARVWSYWKGMTKGWAQGDTPKGSTNGDEND